MRKRSEVAGAAPPSTSAADANARSGGRRIVRVPNGIATGTFCEVCRGPQTMTEGGVTCPAGHGGAGSLAKDGEHVFVERIEPHPIHLEQYGPEIAGRPSKPAAENSSSQDSVSQDVGEEVTVAWGEERIQPVQFNPLSIGPFSGTTRVRLGETRITAGLRLYAELEAIAQATRASKTKEYLDWMATVGAEVERRR